MEALRYNYIIYTYDSNVHFFVKIIMDFRDVHLK